jgi:hypothetical protein
MFRELVASAALAAIGGPGVPGPGTQIAGCPILPSGHPFNRDVSRAPVDRRSATYIRSIGLRGRLHAGFTSDFWGIPYSVVPAGQKRVPVRFTHYPYESDKGPYPIPADAKVEPVFDQHVLVLQQGSCVLYELFGARRSRSGWRAASGARFDLRSGTPRPEGWTSADAAGLPILPGLARADEIAGRGEITHALRMTAPRTQRAYVEPASHLASSHRSRRLPPMGLRLRLKASFDLSLFHGQALVVLRALKRYGLIIADNGPAWTISGTKDRRWDDANLKTLERVPGSAFEAVRTGRLVRR